MDDKLRKWHELDVLENIATELMRLRVLKEHELGSTNSVFVSRSPRRRDLRAWHLRARSRDVRRVLGRGILQGVPALRFATTKGGMLVCRPPGAPSIGASKHTSSARIETCFIDLSADI